MKKMPLTEVSFMSFNTASLVSSRSQIMVMLDGQSGILVFFDSHASTILNSLQRSSRQNAT
jgi:hypothetical protein